MKNAVVLFNIIAVFFLTLLITDWIRPQLTFLNQTFNENEIFCGLWGITFISLFMVIDVIYKAISKKS